jgi:hypothetical protein
VSADLSLWPAHLDSPISPDDVVISTVDALAIDQHSPKAILMPAVDLFKTYVHRIW